MMNTKSPSPGGQPWLAVALVLIAGYVDAHGLITVGAFVSFMSGNTTRTGEFAGRGMFSAAAPHALAIGFFVVGSFAGNWVSQAQPRRARRLLYGAIAFLLGVVLAGSLLASLDDRLVIAILSAAMGMMNTTLSHIDAEPANMTYVTGTLNKIGRHLAQAARGAQLEDARGSWDTHLRRAGLLALLWSGFLCGAALSGAATEHFGASALIAPILVLIALAVVSGEA